MSHLDNRNIPSLRFVHEPPIKERELKKQKLLGLCAVVALGLAACGSPSDRPDAGSGDASGEIIIDGSSTVFPISEAVAEEWQIINPNSHATVAQSGTGGGFKKFCNNETDISDASRPIKDEEAAICAAAGIEFIEIEVATDGLSVVVNSGNDFAECLTTEELKKAWEPDSSVKTWADIRSGFPSETVKFYAPGADSGTFDYFTEEVVGEAKAMRQEELQTSEDDNILVTGIKGDEFSLGFFGYSYFKENADSIKAVGVDAGEGCIEPTDLTIEDGTYAPLSRPLFIYVSKKSLADKPQVGEFATFYLELLPTITTEVGYINLPEARLQAAKDKLATP